MCIAGTQKDKIEARNIWFTEFISGLSLNWRVSFNNSGGNKTDSQLRKYQSKVRALGSERNNYNWGIFCVRTGVTKMLSIESITNTCMFQSIQNQQQLKVYCEELENKNQEL